jgi:hypothetical protein
MGIIKGSGIKVVEENQIGKEKGNKFPSQSVVFSPRDILHVTC